MYYKYHVSGNKSYFITRYVYKNKVWTSRYFLFFLPIRSRYSIRDLVPTGCVKIVVANIELYLPGSCYMFWVNHILLINVSKVVLVVPSYVRNWSKPFDLCFMYQNEYCDLIISRLQYAHMQSRLDTM